MKTPLALPILIIATAFTSAAFQEAKTAVLAYEHFDYTTGSLSGRNGGDGWQNSWSVSGSGASTVTSPGSDYPDLVTSGNKATLDTAVGPISAFRDLDEYYSTGTVYISFLAENTNEGQRFFGLSLFDGATEQLLIGKNGGTAAAFQNWGLGAGATQANSSISSYDLSLLVVRIDFSASGNETIRLYINPTSDIEPVTADASITTVNITGFDRIRLAAGYTNGIQSSISGTIDEFRLGTTFADVSPVPEPGAASLAFVGLFSLVYAARRRKSRMPRA